MTSETDAEFVERIKREWDGDNVPCVEDFDQLIAIARRGAAVQWRPIEEAPPEFKRMLATDGDVRGEAWRHGDRYYWVDDSAAGDITHWMFLPPPPSGEPEHE